MNIPHSVLVRIVRSYRKLSAIADLFARQISNGHRTIIDDIAWDLESILILASGDLESDLTDSAVHKLLTDPSLPIETVAQRIAQ